MEDKPVEHVHKTKTRGKLRRAFYISASLTLAYGSPAALSYGAYKWTGTVAHAWLTYHSTANELSRCLSKNPNNPRCDKLEDRANQEYERFQKMTHGQVKIGPWAM